MNRRLPIRVATSGRLADGLLLVSGVVLILLAVIAVAAGAVETAAQLPETNTPAAVVAPKLTQQRLSDWLDRNLRREERALRRKVIC